MDPLRVSQLIIFHYYLLICELAYLMQNGTYLKIKGEDDDDEEDDEDDFGEEYDADDQGMEDDEEEVEILLSFEHRDKEFHIVRLLDPVLLVGINDAENEERRILLSPKQADAVMPALEKIFLQNQQKE